MRNACNFSVEMLQTVWKKHFHVFHSITVPQVVSLVMFCLPILIWSTSVQKKGHCVFATSPIVNPVIPMKFGVVFQHLAILWEIKKAHHICLVQRWSMSFNRKVLMYSEVGPTSYLSQRGWFPGALLLSIVVSLCRAVPCRDSRCSGVLWCASQISPGPTPTPSVHCTSSLPHR